MTLRPRILALIAAAALLPAAAQAHWVDPCGCRPHYYWHHHYRYAPRLPFSRAVELTQYVFAVPYRLRNYPYASGYGGEGPAYGAPAVYGRRSVEPRAINADAQITIHGPDRMTIELLRKGHGTIIHRDDE
jgi:hypothetical protein